MSPAAELVLDREVRDWVLLPLTACVLLMQLLRQYVAQVRRRGAGVGCGLPAALLGCHRRRHRRCCPPCLTFAHPSIASLCHRSCLAGPRWQPPTHPRATRCGARWRWRAPACCGRMRGGSQRGPSASARPFSWPRLVQQGELEGSDCLLVAALGAQSGCCSAVLVAVQCLLEWRVACLCMTPLRCADLQSQTVCAFCCDFCLQDSGVFEEKVEKPDMQQMMMTNPDMMQVGAQGGQLVAGGWVGGLAVQSITCSVWAAATWRAAYILAILHPPKSLVHLARLKLASSTWHLVSLASLSFTLPCASPIPHPRRA